VLRSSLVAVSFSSSALFLLSIFLVTSIVRVVAILRLSLTATNVTVIFWSSLEAGTVILEEQVVVSQGMVSRFPTCILKTQFLSFSSVCLLNASTEEKSNPMLNSVTADYPVSGVTKII
jgi:hypothetical protein